MQKTLVIGANMHGVIPLMENGYPNRVAVPPNMYINMISASAPGVPNICKFENYESLSENVSERIQGITNWNTFTKNEVDNLANSIQELLITNNKEQSDDIINFHRQSYKKNNLNVHFQNFAHHYDKSYIIKTYKSGDSIPEKFYIKFRDGEVELPEDSEEIYFNKIVLYNLDGQPDLFELLETMGMHIDQINTSQMIELLSNLGVENIIIVDLSCSVFTGAKEFITPRHASYTRRNMLKGGINKKNRKSKIKKMKMKRCKTKRCKTQKHKIIKRFHK
jgi:hypothetical protein